MTTLNSKYYEILLKLLRTSDTLWEQSRIFFSKFGISPSQFNILNLLYENKDGMTQIILSRKLLTHRSNVTGLLKRLERRKLIKRHTSQSDKRATLVQITSNGKTLIENILPEFHKIIDSIFTNVEIKNPSEFLNILTQIETSALLKAESLKEQKNNKD